MAYFVGFCRLVTHPSKTFHVSTDDCLIAWMAFIGHLTVIAIVVAELQLLAGESVILETLLNQIVGTELFSNWMHWLPTLGHHNNTIPTMN